MKTGSPLRAWLRREKAREHREATGTLPDGRALDWNAPYAQGSPADAPADKWWHIPAQPNPFSHWPKWIHWRFKTDR